MSEPIVQQELPRSANNRPPPQGNMLFDDLADYQRCWEEIHQQTLKQIQLIKEAEEKTAASTRSHNVRVGTETKS